MIPRSVRLSESPSHGLSVLEYDGKSSGAEAYRSLAAELIGRAAAKSNGAIVAESDEAAESDQPRKSWSLKSLFAREKEKGRKMV